MGDESFAHLKKLTHYNIGNAERVDTELRRLALS